MTSPPGPPARLNVAIHEQLLAAVDGRRGVEAADRLCEACVVLFDIDAAAISLVFDGASSGTLGSSSVAARTYDELQFTLGEGPCLDSVVAPRTGLGRRPRRSQGGSLARLRPRPARPRDPRRLRDARRSWPANTSAPSTCSAQQPGQLDGEQFAGRHRRRRARRDPAARPARWRPQAAVSDPDSDAWAELNALSRAEVSQATGMLVAQLGVEPAEALVRLRAYAYATGRSATDVARDILDRRLRLEAD